MGFYHLPEPLKYMVPTDCKKTTLHDISKTIFLIFQNCLCSDLAFLTFYGNVDKFKGLIGKIISMITKVHGIFLFHIS